MMKLRGAVVGLGKMGLLHYGIVNTNPNVEITSLCDKQALILKMVNKLKPQLNVYSDYKNMFKNEQLDFVLIATPIKYHYEIILEALTNNVHVFVEKPLTTTAEEGEKLVDLINKNRRDLVCQVGYVNRYQEIFNEVKKILEKNVIGDIFNFSIEMYAGIIRNDRSNSWRSDNNIAGGGCLIEFASHVVDLICWYFGAPDKINDVQIKKIYSKNVEDYIHASFNYDNGIWGWLNSCWSDPTYRLPLTKFQCSGSNGKIIAQEHEVKIFLHQPSDEFNSGWNSFYLPDVAKTVRIDIGGSLFTLQLDDFIDTIINKNEQHENSFAAALQTTKIIDQIYGYPLKI